MDWSNLTIRMDSSEDETRGSARGITFVEKLSYEKLNEIGGGYPNEIFTVGGGAINNNWSKIRTNILNLKIKKPLSTEASFGPALIAGGFLKKNEKH